MSDAGGELTCSDHADGRRGGGTSVAWVVFWERRLLPDQLVLLLEHLLEQKTLSPRTLQSLQRTYHLQDQDAEVRHRWCELIVKHKFTKAYKSVERFLQEDQGQPSPSEELTGSACAGADLGRPSSAASHVRSLSGHQQVCLQHRSHAAESVRAAVQGRGGTGAGRAVSAGLVMCLRLLCACFPGRAFLTRPSWWECWLIVLSPAKSSESGENWELRIPWGFENQEETGIADCSFQKHSHPAVSIFSGVFAVSRPASVCGTSTD
ncbi:PREDICTED: aminopeptidase O isoform X2 [Rhinopithecus bieti]|uniref:aminopeptidase O isoform X2 n=1 Tax=Rhinopithecus bieti TaxID=61621 RepID=UPI00083C1BFF|nr:PREDICTED: aminopeptidase O isoform X2 [Rhinopithecus bieti]